MLGSPTTEARKAPDEDPLGEVKNKSDIRQCRKMRRTKSAPLPLFTLRSITTPTYVPCIIASNMGRTLLPSVPVSLRKKINDKLECLWRFCDRCHIVEPRNMLWRELRAVKSVPPGNFLGPDVMCKGSLWALVMRLQFLYEELESMRKFPAPRCFAQND